MDPLLQKILDEYPEMPPRSRLEPHRELIRQLRNHKRTYKQIRSALAELGCSVSPSTLCEFVKRRRIGAPKRQIYELEPIETVTARSALQAKFDAMRQQKPVAQPAKKLFEYEQGKPLTLTSDKGKPEN